MKAKFEIVMVAECLTDEAVKKLKDAIEDIRSGEFQRDMAEPGIKLKVTGKQLK